MTIFTRDKVIFSADKQTYWEFDPGTGTAALYVNGTLVQEFTSSGQQDVQMDVGTATATAGAAELNKAAGKVTTEALTTAQNAIYTLTLTNSEIAAADMVFASVADGTNTQGTPMIGQVNPGAGSVVIEVINKHATAEALNGTLEISFHVIKA
jgi:hypothetical protein